jgi:hypothetical protein
MVLFNQVARELARAHIGVILVPARPFPAEWQNRRVLPGPPLTEKSQIRTLIEHGVTVGLGVLESMSHILYEDDLDTHVDII